MTNFLPMAACRCLSVLALGVMLSMVVSSAGWAQFLGSGPVGTNGRMTGRDVGTKAEKPELPAPEAIPGAKARQPVVPATRSATDMQPTDALFDAINRGDIAAARDALNRGADLNGVNILGMTPMELSVDLGRNDISFLLLSMRGEDSSRGSRAIGRDAATPASLAKTAQALKHAAPARGTPAKGPKDANSIVATKPVAIPKLFANDGGTPQPSAGFLGFDSRSVTN